MGTPPGAPAISERIRQLRNGLMTQTDLAAAADVSPDLICKLEQGQRNIVSIASLHRIVRTLDVDLGDLLGRRGVPESAPHPSCTEVEPVGHGDRRDPLDAVIEPGGGSGDL